MSFHAPFSADGPMHKSLAPARAVSHQFDIWIETVTGYISELQGSWAIEPHVDFEGNASIVFIPEQDDTASATFVLYPDVDAIRVAVVEADSYAELGSFPSMSTAMQEISLQISLRTDEKKQLAQIH